MSDFTFRTRPAAHYISPNAGEMTDMAKKVGLSGFNKPLVADLCNLAAGGSICSPSAYRPVLQGKADELLPAADQNGQWSLKGGGKTASRSVALQEKVVGLMAYHQNICDFLSQVEVDRFPGSSPLEQAMNLLKLLSKNKGGEGAAKEDGTQLPIFAEGAEKSPEKVADSLHELMELIDDLDGTEHEMLDPDGNNLVDDVDQNGQPTGGKSLNAMKCAEDLVEGSDARVMLDISRTLDKFTKLQVRRQRKLEVDPAGEEIRSRGIKHLGELSRVSPTAWALRQAAPMEFLRRAVTGQLPVRERVTRIEKKQAIFILVDGSGSMSGRKHLKATGVVMNRLKAVLNGDAEVWVSVFDTQMSKPSHASNAEEAKELIKKFRQGNFRGGGTDIKATVKAAHAFIEAKMKAGEALYRPEVIVLTDEDTSTEGLRKADVPGTRVHGFAIERKNPLLVRFAESTGGVGIENF